MIRRGTLALLVALAFTAPASAQPPAFDASTLAEQAIATVRKEAFRSGKVDWPALEAKVRAAAGGARDEVDMLAVYALLLDGLGDGHSFVQTSEDRRKAYRDRHGREFDAGLTRRPQTSGFIMRREREVRALALANGASVTLLTVPKVFGGGAGAKAYANGLYGALAESAGKACGYVLDLRGNIGGNVWPMLTGLSPLLDDGFATGEQDAAGAVSVYANIERGAAVIAGGDQAGVTIIAVDGWRELGLAGAPVAILIDDGVASSGEGVLAAFAGRAHSRTFGQASYGVASSNAGFQQPDGANLVITVAMMTDRQGRIYPHGFTPDSLVAAGPGLASDPDDAVVEAAKAWLVSQQPCGRR